MRWIVAVLLSVFVSSLALAQTNTPPAPPAPPMDPRLNFCTKVAAQVENQRNAALAVAAQCNANGEMEHEELVKAQGEIADLKKKLAAVPAATPATPASAPATPAPATAAPAQ